MTDPHPWGQHDAVPGEDRDRLHVVRAALLIRFGHGQFYRWMMQGKTM
jgi:hypothetical protein